MSIHRKRVLAGAVTLIITCSLVSAPSSYATPVSTAPSISTQKNHSKGNTAKHAAVTNADADLDPAFAGIARQMEEDLNYIMSIPDEVLLQGDVATQIWVQRNPVTGTAEVTTSASVVGCTAAIAELIAGNLIGAAKLLKIKRYIKELGGVAEAVRIMWGASFNYEKLRALGGSIGALVAELVGITKVREKCFN